MKKRDEAAKTRSGCLGLLLEVGAWVASTILTTVGVLFLVFGAFTFSPEVELITVLQVLAAPVGAYFLIRIGRSILQDLRDQRDQE